MPADTTIREWVEVCATYLSDSPPNTAKHEATLVINRCVLRREPGGRRYIRRSAGIETLTAGTLDALELAVAAYVTRGDVRVLATGVEANDVARLPIRD